MKIQQIVQDPITLFYQTFMAGGKDYLGLSAILGFSLLETNGILKVPDAWKAAMGALSLYGDLGIVVDQGITKTRGEFFLAGSAFPYALSNNAGIDATNDDKTPLGGNTAAGVRVSMEIGTLKRDLLVIGKTPLEGVTIGTPEPFESVPLSWANTSKSLSNPFGQEKDVTLLNNGKVLAWPQVTEWNRGALGDPKTFSGSWPHEASPLPRAMGPDFSKSGSYGREYLLSDWPGFPKDFDFNVFSLAQENQRLPNGYFVGNESFKLEGVHPLYPIIKGNLPYRKVRVVARKLDNDNGSSKEEQKSILTEAPMVLDTVWFFPYYGAGMLIWHGSMAINDIRALELKTLFAFSEDIKGVAYTPSDILKAEELKSFAPLETVEPQKGGKKKKIVLIKKEEESLKEAKTPPEPKPEEPVPMPKVPELPKAPPLPLSAPTAFSIASLIDEVRNDLKEHLPFINQAMVETGNPPITLDTLEPYLEAEKNRLTEVYDMKQEINATEEIRSRMSPLEQEAFDKKAFLEKVTKGGLTPVEAENIEKALSLPTPYRNAFETDALYEEALENYGAEWARLFGVPEVESKLFVDKIKATEMLLQGKGDKAELSGMIFGEAGPEKSKILKNAIMDSKVTVPPDIENKKIVDDLISKGFINEEEGQKFISSVDELMSNSPKGELNFDKLTQSVKTFAISLSAAFGLDKIEILGKLNGDFDLIRKNAWGTSDMGESLNAIAVKYPSLKPSLPELHRLRKGIYGDTMSLSDLAKKAGVYDPEILLAIGLLDPLNQDLPSPLPKAEPIIPEKKETEENIGKEPKGEPFPMGKVFTSREDFIIALERVRNSNGEFPLKAINISVSNLDLSNIDLSNFDLTGLNATETDFTKTSFESSNLTNAIFEQAHLKDANFNNTKAMGTNFRSLPKAKFSINGAIFNNADFSNANLLDLDFEEAALYSSDFSGTSLPLKFTSSNLVKCTFNNNDLQGASFKGADLTLATFTSVNLQGADFTGGTLKTASFTSCPLNKAVFEKVTGTGIRMYLATTLDGASFKGADISLSTILAFSAKDVNFEGAFLKKTNFSNLDLRGSNFAGSNLRESLFFEADLSDTTFDGADLMKVSLASARLNGASFEGASLYGANVYRAFIDKKTSFKDADLNATLLTFDGETVVKN